MKNLFKQNLNSAKLIGGLIISLIVFSCSSDEIDSDPISKSGVQDLFIEYNDIKYVANKDNSIARYVNDEFEYNIFSAEGHDDYEFGNYDGVIRITNPATGEYFEIIDVVQNDNYVDFSIVTSTNVRVSGVRSFNDDLNLSITTQTDVSEAAAWWRRAVVVVRELIDDLSDLLEDTPMEQCRASMPTDCPPGKAPYMEFNDGWFNTSCNVGCR